MKKSVARVIAEFDEEFSSDMPAYQVSVVSSNPNIIIEGFEWTPFSAKFTIVNNSNDHQLVAGSIDNYRENFIIFGKTLHQAQESKVSVSVNNDDGDEVEIASEWIQDKSTAEAVANWVKRRMATQKIVLELDIVGNPNIEVADILSVYHHEMSINAKVDYVVSSVRQSWNSGLETSVKLVQL